MASGIYDTFKSGLMKGTYNVNTGGHAIKIALMGVGYSFNASTHALWADVSANEATGVNYSTGGTTITSSVDVSSNVARFKTSGDITWASSTITAYGAIIYDSTASSSPLIAWIDFGGGQSSSNGNFTISWTSQSNIIISLS